MLEKPFLSDLVWRLGWTLLHSLWEVLLVGATVALALSMLARKSANIRYWVACCGMASLYIPLIPTFVSAPTRPTVTAGVTVQTDGDVPVDDIEDLQIVTNVELGTDAVVSVTSSEVQQVQSSAKLPAVIPINPTDSVSAWLPWIVGAWLAVVGLLSLSHIGGWFYAFRLRQLAKSPTSVATVERFQELALRMGVRRTVQLLESVRIDVPIAFGWLKPVVLLPPSLLTGLSPAELDAVIAHELAHIRRYDYLVNLLQTFTETLLFFHPVVWILSRRIRTEREYCCDDEAIAICGGKVDYARALATVEASRTPQLAMSFLGKSKNMTLDRVRRIMGASPSNSHSWMNGGLASLLLIASLIIALLLPSETEADSQEVTEPASGNSRFRMDIQFEGESDKPFYNFTLSNFATNKILNNFWQVQKVDAKDEKIARAQRWLKESNFYDHAKQGEIGSTDLKQRYLLRVNVGDEVFVEDLGWGLGTLLRLRSLQSVLNGGKKRNNTKLDPMLSRLAGYQKLWTQSRVINDVKTRLTGKRKSFQAGQPIRVK